MPDQKTMRHWLNPTNHGDTGSVKSHWNLEDYGDSTSSLNADLTLRDCSRQICLDFSVYGSFPKVLKNIELRRKKIEILRKHLDNMEAGLDRVEEKFNGA